MYMHSIDRLLKLTKVEIKFQQDSISFKDLLQENNNIINKYKRLSDSLAQSEGSAPSFKFEKELQTLPPH